MTDFEKAFISFLKSNSKGIAKLTRDNINIEKKLILIIY